MEGQVIVCVWRERTHGAITSGTTIKSWYLHNGFSQDQFCYWNRRILYVDRSGGDGAVSPTFLPRPKRVRPRRGTGKSDVSTRSLVG